MVLNIFISLLSITILFFQEIYKVLPVISFVGIANASLWCITSLTGDPMAPSTQGVNVASLIRSWLLLWPSSLCLSTSQRYSSSRRSMERQRDQKYSKHQENNCWTTIRWHSIGYVVFWVTIIRYTNSIYCTYKLVRNSESIILIILFGL